MNITISGHHLRVTESLRDFVTAKMNRLNRHSNDLQAVHVILNVEKIRQKAEATVVVRGAELYADTSDTDMYAAIDVLIDKLDRQLIKYKEKLKIGHRRRQLRF